MGGRWKIDESLLNGMRGNVMVWVVEDTLGIENGLEGVVEGYRQI